MPGINKCPELQSCGYPKCVCSWLSSPDEVLSILVWPEK
jgi:hypothetical protein